MLVFIFVSLPFSKRSSQHLLPTKIMPRPKDDPATERFLDNFYKNSADVLFRPMLYEVPDYKELRGKFDGRPDRYYIIETRR